MTQLNERKNKERGFTLVTTALGIVVLIGMVGLAVDNLLACFAGQRPPACVNPEVLTQP